MGTDSGPRTVEAVQKSVDVIELLKDRGSAGVTEIADALGHSKGTVHSHVSTLVENDYLVNEGGEYRLSLRFLELGEAVKDNFRIYDIVCDELDDLATESGELAQFATGEHGRAVYIYKAYGDNAVQTASSVGNREHMHRTALGKAMLAHLPRERVEEVIDAHGLPRSTDQTITTRKELFGELATVREQGYAFDREELIEGLRCVAAPVTTENDVLGAVSISGPASRFEGDLFREELPKLVTRSANVIEINSQFS